MKKEAIWFFASVVIGCIIIIPYGMHRSAPPQPLNVQSDPKVPFVLPKAEPAPVRLAKDNNAPVEFSDATDPSGLGHLFFGQIIAIGYGSNMHIDENLKILVVGALADEVGGQITPESIKDAYKKATIISIENGNSIWEGRKLPASLTIVDISMVNRAAGKYDHVCMKFLGISDKEFDYIRAPTYIFCDKDKDEQQVNSWKKEVNFETTSNYKFNKGYGPIYETSATKSQGDQTPATPVSKGAAQLPPDVLQLTDQWLALNETCRGNSGDDPKTLKACQTRDAVDMEIRNKGWCWGHKDDAGYQRTWLQCKQGTVTHPSP